MSEVVALDWCRNEFSAANPGSKGAVSLRLLAGDYFDEWRWDALVTGSPGANVPFVSVVRGISASMIPAVLRTLALISPVNGFVTYISMPALSTATSR